MPKQRLRSPAFSGHAIGRTSWPPHFATQLRAAINRHLAGPQDDTAAGAEVEEALRRCSDTTRLVRDRAPFACTSTLAEAAPM